MEGVAKVVVKGVETGEGSAVARVEVMGEAKVVVEMEEEVTEVVEMAVEAVALKKKEGKEEVTGEDSEEVAKGEVVKVAGSGEAKVADSAAGSGEAKVEGKEAVAVG